MKSVYYASSSNWREYTPHIGSNIKVRSTRNSSETLESCSLLLMLATVTDKVKTVMTELLSNSVIVYGFPVKEFVKLSPDC